VETSSSSTWLGRVERAEVSISSTRLSRVGKRENLLLFELDGLRGRSCSTRLTEYDERRPSSSYSGKPSIEEEKTSHSIRLLARR